MWNSNDIIRIEVGNWIIKMANSPDTRSVISKWWNGPKEDDGQFLIVGTKNIRNELGAIGIDLPTIQFTKNSQINGNEFICYWGIEAGHYSLDNLNDLFEFIYKKTIDYNSGGSSIDLDKSLTCIDKDQYQKAYDIYTRAYYHARLNLDFHVCSRCLTEVAMILAKHNQNNLANLYASTAIDYAEGLNIVDSNLKCQCYFNAANLVKYLDPYKAIEYLDKCASIAQHTGNSIFLFFSSMTTAEILAYCQHYEHAINNYEIALNLVEDSRIALSIQSSMLQAYKVLLAKVKGTEDPSSLPKWRETVKGIMISVVKQIVNSAISSFIIKVFDINGTFSLFTFGQSIKISDNTFNAPSQIGDNNRIII